MKDQATQKTAAGYEIPIPTRSEFMRNLKKTAKPVPKPRARKPKKKS